MQSWMRWTIFTSIMFSVSTCIPQNPCAAMDLHRSSGLVQDGTARPAINPREVQWPLEAENVLRIQSAPVAH